MNKKEVRHEALLVTLNYMRDQKRVGDVVPRANGIRKSLMSNATTMLANFRMPISQRKNSNNALDATNVPLNLPRMVDTEKVES